MNELLKVDVPLTNYFVWLKKFRLKTDIPLLFMTYLNPVFTYGKEKFLKRCVECGIDGIIVPDMPFEEKDELADICEANGIDLISMIAPTSEDRIELIAREAKGFIYCVSSLGVTGIRENITTDIEKIVNKIRSVTNIPCAVGFGISTAKTSRRNGKNFRWRDCWKCYRKASRRIW